MSLSLSLPNKNKLLLQCNATHYTCEPFTNPIKQKQITVTMQCNTLYMRAFHYPYQTKTNYCYNAMQHTIHASLSLSLSNKNKLLLQCNATHYTCEPFTIPIKQKQITVTMQCNTLYMRAFHYPYQTKTNYCYNAMQHTIHASLSLSLSNKNKLLLQCNATHYTCEPFTIPIKQKQITVTMQCNTLYMRAFHYPYQTKTNYCYNAMQHTIRVHVVD